ncbi:uncharacterized protein LOC131479287 [Ochotona princeps]|uniref:uncharacterized protein LOC131479287 n=1 Tax=Ochotona princeps TaxID=9978 RepID=UPI0027150033|nr:uncharacterized protein LOC131479287 [Ochotona princeps]
MLHERKEDEAMVKKDDLPLPRHYPYAIIVVPTRELALQVTSWSRRLCRKTPIRTQLLLGSYTRWPFGTLTLPTSPDVILCTPQVLAGFTRGGGYKKKTPLFEQVQMLVVDEADMLLEGGYKKQMDSIFLEFRHSDKKAGTAGRRPTQYVFAAATIPDRGPVSIRKTIASLCPGANFLCTRSLHCQKKELNQEFLQIPADASFDDRVQLLFEKLQEIPSTEKVMIFCNTAQTAKHVLQVLEKILPPNAKPTLFSSDVEQADRARNLGLFAREKSKVLVCTDAASRGLDIEGVSSIIQFDFALDAVSHLHRVGRVARAGRCGRAINFYEAKSKPLVDAVRQAASDDTHGCLAGIFSRKRSFRKSIKKGENTSMALVVESASPEGG